MPLSVPFRLNLLRFALAALVAAAHPAPAQTHRITVHANQRVASLEMTTAEYTSWKANDDFNDDKNFTLNPVTARPCKIWPYLRVENLLSQ